MKHSLYWLGAAMFILMAAWAPGVETAGPSGRHEVQLAGLRVTLEDPVEVTAQLAWQISSGTHEGYPGKPGSWAFIAAFPGLGRFPTGELIVMYSLVPDTNQNPVYSGAFQISSDGGKSWGHRYEVLPEHQPQIFVPQEDGSLVAVPAQLYPLSAGDKRNFHASYIRYEQGGRRMILEPAGVKVLDWPWPVEAWPRQAPASNWYVQMAFDGSALKLGDRWLATAYARKEGERLQRNLVLASSDAGRTWTYWSTIAQPSDLEASPERGYTGPSETAMIQLQDGDLMAVYRVGSGRAWNLHRSYSKDQGRTWTRPQPIPPYSVEPSLLRIHNETIVLATGRPGIRLWLSTDGRGEKWQDVDIVAHHNQRAPDPSYQILPRADRPDYWRTSSYTELVEVSPNRVLLVYDRAASPAPSDERDKTRVFVLPIEIRRE